MTFFNCFSLGRCFETDTEYDVEHFAQKTGIASALDCYSECVATPTCTHFTFATTSFAEVAAHGLCRLKTSSGTKKTLAGLTSGPITC